MFVGLESLLFGSRPKDPIPVDTDTVHTDRSSYVPESRREETRTPSLRREERTYTKRQSMTYLMLHEERYFDTVHVSVGDSSMDTTSDLGGF